MKEPIQTKDTISSFTETLEETERKANLEVLAEVENELDKIATEVFKTDRGFERAEYVKKKISSIINKIRKNLTK